MQRKIKSHDRDVTVRSRLLVPVVVMETGPAPGSTLLYRQTAGPVAASVGKVGIEALRMVAAHGHVPGGEKVAALSTWVTQVSAQINRDNYIRNEIIKQCLFTIL